MSTENRPPRHPDPLDVCIAGFIMLLWWPLFAWSAPCDQHRTFITREAQFRFGIPSPAPVIRAQIQQESACNPAAKSRVGASGLMQFMPATADWAATAGNLGASDPLNPYWSIRAGIWYDRWLLDRIKQCHSECDCWMFALSGYNGGLGYVYKRQKLSSDPKSWDVTGRINPGIHPANQHENESYGPRILLKHQPQFSHWGKTVCLK